MFTRPLDSPLVFDGLVAAGEVVVVTYEALRASSSYVLVAREISAVSSSAEDSTHLQGFVDQQNGDVIIVNGTMVGTQGLSLKPVSKAALQPGVLVEIDVVNVDGAYQAVAIRLMPQGLFRPLTNLLGPPLG